MSELHLGTHGAAKQSRSNSRTKQKMVRTDAKDWTIKGLPTETVEIARDAARQSGMKINAWVSKVFSDAADKTVPSRIIDGDSIMGPRNAEDEIRNLRLKNEELIQTVNTLSTVIAKMYK